MVLQKHSIPCSMCNVVVCVMTGHLNPGNWKKRTYKIWYFSSYLLLCCCRKKEFFSFVWSEVCSTKYKPTSLCFVQITSTTYFICKWNSLLSLFFPSFSLIWNHKNWIVHGVVKREQKMLVTKQKNKIKTKLKEMVETEKAYTEKK